MFVIFRQPLADLRGFVPTETQMRPMLTWEEPWRRRDAHQYREWVPLVGAMMDGDDSTYCHARRLVRFDKPLGPYVFEAGTHQLTGFQGQSKVGSRRYCPPQAVSNLEVRLERRRPGPVLSGAEVDAFAGSVLGVEVKAGDPLRTVPLAECGSPVADLLLRATTRRLPQGQRSLIARLLGRNPPAPPEPESWWLTAGLPMLLLTFRQGEFANLDQVAEEVEVGKTGLRLHCGAHHFNGRPIPVWLIECQRGSASGSGMVKNSPSETHDARQLRLLLQRLHSEIETTHLILARWTARQLTLAPGTEPTAALERHVKAARALLTAKAKYGTEEKWILQAAQAAVYRLHHDDDVPQLVERLDRLLRAIRPFIG